jgi:hypothetical protein
VRNELSKPRFHLVILLAFLSSFGFAQVSVLTRHNDNSRTGQNLNETYLNTSTVNVSNFGKIFSRSVDGYLYAQPLYLSNLDIQGQTRNVVYVATEHNSVYAFDADDPNASTPLWQVNLGTSVPSQDICQIQATDGCNGKSWPDLTPEIGITSTPVIDPSTNTIYVVAKTKTTQTCSDGTIYCDYHFFLHALDLLTGSEKFGGPVEITIPSSSPVSFIPLNQLQRPGLLLVNGGVYVAFGSAGDFLVWHGWVVGYDASTLQQLGYYVTTPDNMIFDNGGETGGGGVFLAGQGLIADSDNNIYFTTSNGPFDVDTGGLNYGDSALKLSTPALSVADYFAPFNAYNGSQSLGATNTDLGAGGQLLIPGANFLVGGGKDGILRVINSANMGKFNATLNQDVQEFQATSAWIMGSPVYWNGPLGQWIYLWTSGDVIKAWQFNGSTFQTTPVSKGTFTSPGGEGDTSGLSVSANQSQAGTGIIWAPTSNSGDPSFGVQPGILHAFDASKLSTELWNSQLNSARDNAGNYAKFNSPTIANGKVYLPTFSGSGQLLVYGLTSPYFGLLASPNSATVISGSSTSYTISVTGTNGFSSAVSLACSGLPSGASCSFNPPSVTPSSSPATSTLTISTVSGTTPNTYNVAVTGTSASVSHNTGVSLIVQGVPTPDFAISATSPVTVSAGATVTSVISITAQNGFTGTVNFSAASCTGLPSGATCAFNPSSVTGSGSSTLTIATSASTPTGTYSVTVTGTSGSLTHATTVTLTVTPTSGSFSLSSPNPASVTVTAGSSATTTITVTPSGGFVGTVNLSCMIATSASPAPACSSTSVTVSGAPVQATLTVTTTAPHASLQPSSSIFFAMLLPVGGMALLGAGLTSRRRRLMSLILIVLVISGLLFLAACGGGSSSSGGGGGGGGGGTPAGTYVVTVTGTSGSLSSQPTTLTLTVQ